ncbi:MAG: UvrB/UvrC motif-containing protein [Phycisphaerales bacterium]|nr:MAG: UvrB/UvrC motif-containing protein [Phycisphaerales bacterium]
MAANSDNVFDNVIDLPVPGAALETSALPPGGGVYAFMDENDSVLQTIGTQSLRRSIHHRLSPPDDAKRRRGADLRAIARRVRWTPTFSVFETYLAYLNIARRLTPDRYRKELAFGPVWFARVDPNERFPRWQTDTVALSTSGVDVGPFRDRSHCAAFVELLEDLFDLCRRHDILVRAPNGRRCVYFEMGKCPAPCDGSISPDAYRDAIGRSIDFATGGHELHLQGLEQQMRLAAAAQAYERAAYIKDTLARARKLLRSDGRLTPTPEQFRFLIVQRAGGTSRVKPFFVNRGAISVGEQVRLKGLGEAVPAWLAEFGQLESAPQPDAVYGSECIWLVSHFLLKGDKAPGLFLPASRLDDPSEVARQVDSRFRRPRRQSENMRDTGPAVPEVDPGP